MILLNIFMVICILLDFFSGKCISLFGTLDLVLKNTFFFPEKNKLEAIINNSHGAFYFGLMYNPLTKEKIIEYEMLQCNIREIRNTIRGIQAKIESSEDEKTKLDAQLEQVDLIITYSTDLHFLATDEYYSHILDENFDKTENFEDLEIIKSDMEFNKKEAFKWRETQIEIKNSIEELKDSIRDLEAEFDQFSNILNGSINKLCTFKQKHYQTIIEV
ncbi:hypothetical protein BB560_005132 [Smittium megazygosporum]|uniref:Uncharacterized protein n=1 Tax=Smittium megazygosporum TaxID=133381 RepID=A0A2T9Z7G4_9FUNG|nr:hypothetical protein BB560_005132 [Smittium megazygosporum]